MSFVGRLLFLMLIGYGLHPQTEATSIDVLTRSENLPRRRLKKPATGCVEEPLAS